MERLFLAIDFPLNIKGELFDFYKKYQDQDINGIKWVKKQNIHITLKFFGNTTLEEKKILISSVSEICNEFLSFNMGIEKTGVFPNIKNPRIIWLGVRDTDGNILKIQELIENNLYCLGFSKEEKRYIPHLTIGRIDNKNNNIINFLKEFLLANLKTSDFIVKELVLFKSILDKKGTVYEPIQVFILKKAKDT